LQVFQNSEFGEFGMLEIDGKAYFPATVAARILGYSNPKDAIIRHCRWVVKRDLPHPQSSTKTLETNFIPEGDLYRLIVHSRLPSAERFEKWVFDEILPTIRKTGTYGQARITLGDVVKMMEMTRDALKAQGATPREVAIALKTIADQNGIALPEFFVKPEAFTLQDAMSMIDFAYSHVGKQPPTYQEFVEWRISTKQIPHRERRTLT
ncbi:MAG: BRO family protein, partial [Kiritimatiellia bacterium]